MFYKIKRAIIDSRDEGKDISTGTKCRYYRLLLYEREDFIMKKIQARTLMASVTLKVRVKYKFAGDVFTEDVYVFVPSAYTNYTHERYVVNERIARIIARKEARKAAVPNDSRWTFWSAEIID